MVTDKENKKPFHLEDGAQILEENKEDIILYEIFTSKFRKSTISYL